MKAAIPILERKHTLTGGAQLRIATDGMKQMYTTKRLAMVNDRYEFQLPLSQVEGENNSTDVYDIKVQLVSIINMRALAQFLKDMKQAMVAAAARGDAVPLREIMDADQLFSVVLKTVPYFRFIPVGRSSFFEVLGWQN